MLPRICFGRPHSRGIAGTRGNAAENASGDGAHLSLGCNTLAAGYVNISIARLTPRLRLTEDCGIAKAAGLSGSITMVSAEVAQGAQVLLEVAGSEEHPWACATEVAVSLYRFVARLWDAVTGFRLP